MKKVKQVNMTDSSKVHNLIEQDCNRTTSIFISETYQKMRSVASKLAEIFHFKGPYIFSIRATLINQTADPGLLLVHDVTVR